MIELKKKLANNVNLDEPYTAVFSIFQFDTFY